MDAIVTAGGIPQVEDVLYPYTQGAPKTLLDLAGKPMIQWVLDTLGSSPLVDRIFVIGLKEHGALSCSKEMEFLPDQGDMVANIREGVRRIVELNPEAEYALVVSSDIPALTTEAVDWVVENVLASQADVVYNVIQREVMEARFPGSKRSYVRLKDVEVCGGDMNGVRCGFALGASPIWDELIAARKNALKQAAMIGFDTLLLVLLRAMRLEQAVQRVSRRLKIDGRAVLCPYAEVAMDVDKPHQLEILRSDLANRGSGI